MKFISSLLALSSLAALSIAAPPSALRQRADKCGQYDTAQAGPYLINNNLWGEKQASPGGSQCFGVDKLAGSSLSWHTSWTWQGGPPGSVKSYPNAQVAFKPKSLSAIASIPSTWSYTLTGNNLVADVSYDLFTSKDPTQTGGGDKHDYEIMIWLSDLGGAKPIAGNYGADGNAMPAASGIQLAGVGWNLYRGVNEEAGGTVVFSFVADKQVLDFKGDLLDFLRYLEKSQGLPGAQNLVYVAAGMEPFTGTDAKLTVTDFSAEVN